MIKMKKHAIIYLVLIGAFLLGVTACSDPVSESERTTVIDGRVLVREMSQAPPMNDPEDDIWRNIPAGDIALGQDSAYTDDFGLKSIFIQMIKTADRLYVRAEWLDVPPGKEPETREATAMFYTPEQYL